MEPRVAIVGAGISGLAAAKTLLQNGVSNIVVLEARNRIGGRVHTIHSGFTFEAGAQWLYGEDGNPMYKEVMKANLEVVRCKTQLRRTYCVDQGRSLSADQQAALDEAVNYCEAIYDSMKTEKVDRTASVNALSSMTAKWKRYCERANDDIKDLLNSMFRCMVLSYKTLDGCDSMEHLTHLSCETYEEIPGNLCVLRNGYSTLPNALSEALTSENLRLNCSVAKIEWDRNQTVGNCDPVLISYYKDSELKILAADHVIMTVSLGCLKTAHQTLFRPALPADKVAALKRIGFGTVDKITMYYDDADWKSGEMFYTLWDKLPTKRCWMHSIYGFSTMKDPHTEKTYLQIWLSGIEAREMEELEDDEIGRVCHDVIKRFSGKKDLPRPSEVHVTRWHQDPYAKGSYSYTAVESSSLDVKKLAEPLPNSPCGKQRPMQLLFAGEATNVKHFSTVHGAYESGRREGNRIINYYQHTTGRCVR